MARVIRSIKNCKVILRHIGGIRATDFTMKSRLHTFACDDGRVFLWSRSMKLPDLEVGKAYFIRSATIRLAAASDAAGVVSLWLRRVNLVDADKAVEDSE